MQQLSVSSELQPGLTTDPTVHVQQSSLSLHWRTHIDGQGNGNEGADQRPPATKEEDTERDKDGKDQCPNAIVTAVGPGVVGGHYRLGLAHHHHIGSVSLWV